MLRVSDPILPFLAADAVALLVLGACAGVLPLAALPFLATMLSGLAVLLCLPPLLMGTPATVLELAAGPPGLSLHFALDPLSAFFLFIVFLAGTALTGFQASRHPAPGPAQGRMTVCCLAGAALSLLAADGVTLAIGSAVMCGAIGLPPTRDRHRIAWLVPLLLLAAVGLLTPPGLTPRFDLIRAAPVDPNRAFVAAALILTAVAALTASQSASPTGARSAVGAAGEPARVAGARSTEQTCTRDTLTAGVLIPAGSYLLLRLIADLGGGASQAGFGFGLLLAGGAISVIQGWRAASHPDIDACVRWLAQRQGGLAMTGIGLAVIARTADLPAAAAFALAATLLSAVSSSVAAVPMSLAAHAIGASAGTVRLSRLGGLIHTMPATSAALAAALIGLAAIPPGLGFASLWLLFQAILAAPRTGGLMFQLPLAMTAAALALSAALATAAAFRLIGIALLGRPRTPSGAGAHEVGRRPERCCWC